MNNEITSYRPFSEEQLCRDLKGAQESGCVGWGMEEAALVIRPIARGAAPLVSARNTVMAVEAYARYQATEWQDGAALSIADQLKNWLESNPEWGKPIF